VGIFDAPPARATKVVDAGGLRERRDVQACTSSATDVSCQE
jgi:hypothetical protein